MSHDGSLGLQGLSLSVRNGESATSRLTSTYERERLREELLRRIVAREETRQTLRRMPR